MGFSGKPRHHQVDVDVIAGIPLRAPLKPVYTRPSKETDPASDNYGVFDDDGSDNCTTPKGEESRIVSSRLTCPPAPRKRKATFKCNYATATGVREFFTPPDLDSVFIRHVQRAK